MKRVAQALVVLSVVYTGATIAFENDFANLPIVAVGSITLYAFDILFMAVVVATFLAAALEPVREPRRWRNVVLLVCVVYVAYELLIIGLGAWAVHDREPVFIARELIVRFAVLFIPFFYAVAFRAMKPVWAIHAVEACAVWLLGYAAWTYATTGVLRYQWAEGDRLYILWGGSFLVFAWLVLSRLLLFRSSLWGAVLAAAGFVGILVSNRRSGFLALFVVTLYQTILNRNSGRRVAITLAVISTVFVAVFLSQSFLLTATKYAVKTSLSVNSANGADRLMRWRLAAQTLVQEPFKDYIWAGREYSLNATPKGGIWGPHLFVLDISVREGVVGLGFWLFVLTSTVVIGLRNRSRDPVTGFALSFLVVYLAYAALNACWYATGNVILLYMTIAIVLHQDRALELAGTQGVFAPEGDWHVALGTALLEPPEYSRRDPTSNDHCGQ